MGKIVRIKDSYPDWEFVGDVLFTWEDRVLIGFFCGGVRTNHSLPDYKPLYKGLKATWSIPYYYLTTTIISKNKFR